MLMERVRSVTKYFMWVVAASFIIFIFFGFGSNIFRGGKQQKENIIAEVNKKEITVREYGDALKSGLQSISGALGTDPIKERQISEITINQLITDKIIEDLLEKRAISISDEQVINIIKESPPSEIIQNPNFWIEGKFDYNRYLELLGDPRAGQFISSYASLIKKNFPLSILRGEISSMARVTSGDAIEKLLKDSVKVRIEYIKLPLEEWKSNETSITPEEFYSKHKEIFRRNGFIKLGYVSFSILVDQEMVKTTEELANSLVERAATDSFELLMSQYSYFPDNRSLYNGWVKIGNLQNNFATAIVKMSKGKVSQPIKSELGFHILKLAERKKDSVDIKEIFLPVFPSYDEFQRVSTSAWELVRKLRADTGLSISEEYNVKYLYLGKGEFPDVPVNFGTFLINPKKGDVSYPLIGEDSFYVFWVLEKEEGIPPFSEIEEEVKDSLINFEAARRARQYAQEKFSADKLPTNPEKGEWRRTPYFTLNDYQNFNIPERVALISLYVEKGVLLLPIRAGEGVFVIRQIDFKMPPNEKLGELIRPVAMQIQQAKETSYFQKWFYHERKSYNVVDLREKVYE